RDLTARYEARFEVEDSDEWTVAMAEYNREADAITAALFAPKGSRGWRVSTSRIGAPSTAGWSGADSTSSGRRSPRTPPICGRRASSTDPPGVYDALQDVAGARAACTPIARKEFAPNWRPRASP